MSQKNASWRKKSTHFKIEKSWRYKLNLHPLIIKPSMSIWVCVFVWSLCSTYIDHSLFGLSHVWDDTICDHQQHKVLGAISYFRSTSNAQNTHTHTNTQRHTVDFEFCEHTSNASPSGITKKCSQCSLMQISLLASVSSQCAFQC